MTSPSERTSQVILILALALYVGLAWKQTDAFMVWDEETMVHSIPAPRVLTGHPEPDGRARFERSCAGADSPTFVLSDGRPRLGVCARGRLWPLMVAPYFSGVFYWPFGLLAPLHHDNVFVLRKLTMMMGALTLLLTYLLVRRFAGHRVAALAALATGVSPCFVLLHAILVHFETLPWLLVTAALLVLAGIPALAPAAPLSAPAPSSRRLVAASLLLGLAVLANLKTLALIGTLAAVAWRLNIGWRRLRWAQVGLIAIAGLLPTIPMIVVYLLPAGDYSDRSSGWLATLKRHILEPERLVPSTRDLLLWWSNVGYYFRDFVAHERLNVVALLVAAGALAFVIVDSARTLWRRQGDAVTVASGACLGAYVVIVALLYDSFPANYTPLHTVFGVALAAAVSRAAAWAAQRTRRPFVALPIALILIAPFGLSSASTIDASRRFRVHTNPITERALIAHLRAHPDPGASILTVDVKMSGVIDSLSDGEFTTLQGGNYFQNCEPRPHNANAPQCLRDRWRALLSLPEGHNLRVVIPLDLDGWQRGEISLLPSLEGVAAELGYTVHLERSFDTADRRPGLALYRIAAGDVRGHP